MTIQNINNYDSGLLARTKINTNFDQVVLANNPITAGINTLITYDEKGLVTASSQARLDQLAAPTENISLNSQNITNLLDPINSQDAATKNYVDNAAGGGGTVTAVSVVTANGFSGTVATATTTPAITLSTTVTGILVGDGTTITAATNIDNVAIGATTPSTGNFTILSGDIDCGTF